MRDVTVLAAKKNRPLRRARSHSNKLIVGFKNGDRNKLDVGPKPEEFLKVARRAVAPIKTRKAINISQ